MKRMMVLPTSMRRSAWLLPLMFLLQGTLCQAQNATADGRTLFTDARRGNCVACHQLPNDPAVKSTSTQGPVLSGLKARFPDRAALRAVIWDLPATIPNSSMPPFGRHRILSAAEIENLVIYLEAL